MKVVIIGNGIAGYTVAEKLYELSRKLKRKIDITIVTKEKTPIYSPCIFHLYLSGELEREKLFIHSFNEYKRKKIKLIFDEVTRIEDGYVLTRNNEEIIYDKLVIAVGSKPIKPPIQGINLNGVFTCKTLADIDNIKSYIRKERPKNAVIIGGGLIGVEMAVALRKLGINVNIVEIMPRILPLQLDREASNIVSKKLREKGIRLYLNTRVAEIIGKEKVEKVIMENGEEIRGELVILAAGMRPNIELVRRSGIKIGKVGGIAVNKYLRTSKYNIYACGDCIEYEDMITNQPVVNMLWINSRIQGEIAASNIMGIRREYIGEYNIVGIDIFDMHVISAGKTEEQLKKGRYDVIEGRRENRYYKIIVNKGKVIGYQLIGETRLSGSLYTLAIKRENIINMIKLIKTPYQLRIMPYIKD